MNLLDVLSQARLVYSEDYSGRSSRQLQTVDSNTLRLPAQSESNTL